MILAVLDKRANAPIGGSDAYLSTVGGVRLTEPAADLAISLALAGAITDRPLPHGTIAFGEVGLAGEIRPVTGAHRRLAEAAPARLHPGRRTAGCARRRPGARRPAGRRGRHRRPMPSAVGCSRRLSANGRRLHPVDRGIGGVRTGMRTLAVDHPARGPNRTEARGPPSRTTTSSCAPRWPPWHRAPSCATASSASCAAAPAPSSCSATTGRRDRLHRRLPARRRVLRDPAARAGEDGRRDRVRPRGHPHPARRHPAGARPAHRDQRVRHPAPHRRAGGQADRLPGHLGEPVDADHRALRRRPAGRARGFQRHPVPRQPGAADPGALQVAPRRGHRHALRARDRGPRHRPRRRQRAPAARDGAPDQGRDRRVRRRSSAPTAACSASSSRSSPAASPTTWARHPRLPARGQGRLPLEEAMANLVAIDSTELLDLAAGPERWASPSSATRSTPR